MTSTPTTLRTTANPDLPVRQDTTRVRVRTVLATVGAAFLAWVVAGPLLGVDISVGLCSAAARKIGPFSVVMASAVAAVAGWILLAVLERLTSRARSAWTVTALAVFAVSLVGPAGAVSAASGITLALLHLVVTVALILGMRRSTAPRY